MFAFFHLRMSLDRLVSSLYQVTRFPNARVAVLEHCKSRESTSQVVNSLLLA